ncbi:MAG: GldG family protein [Pseudomonadota bacterium]
MNLKRSVKNLLLTCAVFAAAIAAYLALAAHPLRWDWSQSRINSLEASSVGVLKQLHGPVRITVFGSEQDARYGDLRSVIRAFVALYQRYKPDMTLVFINPVEQPDAARQAEIQSNGEMVIEYQGKREHLSVLNEQALTNALLRLSQEKEQWVMYLDGHGERKLDGTANHDLGEFGKRLQQRGFRINSLNLSLAQDVPDNISLLVITHPQLDLLPGETEKLLRFLDKGGNLLWLIDPEPLHGLQPLAERLGLVLMPGTVIDPAAEEMGVPPNWALGSGYPPHPSTRNFNLITAFPFARPIGWEEIADWQHTTLVEGAPRGWVSTRSPQDKPKFDKNRDTPGPVTLALALQRNINERDQRIIAVGSGAFLANTFSGNGGNLDLGVNMVGWLASNDRQIFIEPRTAKDSILLFSRSQLNTVSIGLLIGLPLLLVLAGLIQWRRRRS